MVKAFKMVVENDRKRYVLLVEQISETDQIEKYKVSGKNKSLTIQSNRPLLRARNLKYRRPNWKLIEGQLHNIHLLEKIFDTVEAYLKMLEKKPNT